MNSAKTSTYRSTESQLEQLERGLRELASMVTIVPGVYEASRRSNDRRKRSKAAPKQRIGQTAKASLAPAPPVVIPPPLCSDLTRPKEFNAMPPDGASNPTKRTLSTDELKAELKRTQAILHTSGVRAVVWRAWRSYEGDLLAKLRGHTVG